MAILKREVYDVWIEECLNGDQLEVMSEFLKESKARIVTHEKSGTSIFDISGLYSAELIEVKLKKVAGVK